MSPPPDQDTNPSVLSWESVLDASDTDTNPNVDPNAAVNDAPAPAAVKPPTGLAASPADSGDIELTIAPLSLDPLSLDPLPPIVDTAPERAPSALEGADVLGDLHLELPPLELPPLELDDAAVPAASPAELFSEPMSEPADNAPPHAAELNIAPLDLPDLVPSGPVPAVVPDPPAPPPGGSELVAPVASAASMPAVEPPVPSEAAGPNTAPVSPSVAPAADMTRPPEAPAGLPNDPVTHDSAPTTVLPEVGVIPTVPAVSAAPAPASVPAPSIPTLQPNQATLRRAAPATDPGPSEPGPLSRQDRKHQQKLKKQQQKVALKKAKRATSRSGGGGVALFFTLLVLVGLIAGAIIFGRPYLFPDEWDAASQPYAEAIETARDAEIVEPVVVQRRAADVFATSMTEHVVGPWMDDLPTWRSLGLLSGSVDEPILRQLVENWTTAFYSAETGEVIANDLASPRVLDADIAEAMAAAALDQETAWSSSIDDALLDSPALTRASVTASSRTAAAATSFGAADNSVRDIGVSTFLPPVLEYRVNAPLAFAEFSTGDPTQVSADFEAMRVASQLRLSDQPELISGDTLIASQQLTDRTYWYLVFASYVDPATAYAASNDLVQVSLATANNAGTQCTYATFSGTDVTGTARVSEVLQQWAASAPAELEAAVTTLPNGTMQLRTCDPGAAFTSDARFGVGREIARFRSVELAAVAAIPTVDGVVADRAAAIADVRSAQLGLPMIELAFETTFPQSAEQARTLVAVAASVPVEAEG